MTDASVIWHDVECGAYSADFELWDKLANETAGGILDLGCGTGRVGLQLARCGHRVRGLDVDQRLVAAFNERSGSLHADAIVGDARSFSLGSEFGLVLAPMQLLQLFANPDERTNCLVCVARHLSAEGVAAFAVVESMPPSADGVAPLPDSREIDGQVYSSLPVDVQVGGGTIRLRRRRQTVSPTGELNEERNEIVLQALDAPTLEAEARSAGLRPTGRRTISATADHVGSTVVLLEREA